MVGQVHIKTIGSKEITLQGIGLNINSRLRQLLNRSVRIQLKKAVAMFDKSPNAIQQLRQQYQGDQPMCEIVVPMKIPGKERDQTHLGDSDQDKLHVIGFNVDRGMLELRFGTEFS